MGGYTKNLQLYKADVVENANDTFNIDTMMNDNWDIIDAFSKGLRMKTYTNLSQIGLTAGSETIESILTAMPVNSILYVEVGASNADIYPTHYGTFIARKLSASRWFAEFYPKETTDLYVCSAKIENSTFAFYDWKKKADYDDIEEVKKSVSDGKTLVANAITAKGVSTAANATFQTMANNVANIVEGTVISVTLPEGLMYGDVDQDGELTDEDKVIITRHATGYETILDTDSLAMALADVTGDGAVNSSDSFSLGKILTQKSTQSNYNGDYKGNWSVAGDWGTAYDKRFYKDVTVSDSTVGNSAAVFAEADISVRGFKAECFDGYIRVYAKNLPLEAITVNILYTHK